MHRLRHEIETKHKPIMDSFKSGIIKNKLCTRSAFVFFSSPSTSKNKSLHFTLSIKTEEIAFEMQMIFGFKTLPTKRFGCCMVDGSCC